MSLVNHTTVEHFGFNHEVLRHMPRQRRRHYSRSRSRSRSHSHDKDREAKRRKIEQFDSPTQKRSVSTEANCSSGKKKTRIETGNREIEATNNSSETIPKTDVNESENLISISTDSEDNSESDTDYNCESKNDVEITNTNIEKSGESGGDGNSETLEEKHSSKNVNDSESAMSINTSDVILIDSDDSQEPILSKEKSTSLPKQITIEKALKESENSTVNSQKKLFTSKVSITPKSKSQPKQKPIEKAIKSMKLNSSLKSPTENATKESNPSDDKSKICHKQNPIEKAIKQMAKSSPKTPSKSNSVEGDSIKESFSSKLRSNQKPTGISIKETLKTTSEPSTKSGISEDDDTEESSNPSKVRVNLRSKQNPIKKAIQEMAQSTPKQRNMNDSSEKNEESPISKPESPAKEESEETENSIAEPTTPRANPSKGLSGEGTPNRKLTPKQIQKRKESEVKRLEKEKEREEREKQKQEEKDKKEAEKQKKKEQKQKEIEQKQKEKEEKEEQKKREKEQKKIEKEMKEEQKRKEKEEEKLKKQQEIDEKNKEKQKEEEKIQKAKAAFASFFVPKKTSDEKRVEDSSLAFMPFEIKSDMRLPLSRREALTDQEKNYLVELIENNNPNHSYLTDLKKITKIRTCGKTWPCQEDEDDDITIIEDEEVMGQTICEEKPKSERMRAKFLKFHENQRPAYYGTWRKKSKSITGRKPLKKENIFDYDVDSDDDWEEEEQGENLEVVSDDDKENEPENEDYEVDNEFFVPHGHLSDDEVDDEEISALSPESQKQKLKLLKDAFDLDIKSKTHKIIPRSIGCVWYNKNGDNVDEATNRYLQPLNVLTNGQIEIEKRRDASATNSERKKKKALPDIPEDLMPVLVKIIHGNTVKRKTMVEEFLNYVKTNNANLDLSKAGISRLISSIANWTKNVEMKKLCWMVDPNVAERYSIDLVLPNVWEAVKGAP